MIYYKIYWVFYQDGTNYPSTYIFKNKHLNIFIAINVLIYCGFKFFPVLSQLDFFNVLIIDLANKFNDFDYSLLFFLRIFSLIVSFIYIQFLLAFRLINLIKSINFFKDKLNDKFYNKIFNSSLTKKSDILLYINGSKFNFISIYVNQFYIYFIFRV